MVIGARSGKAGPAGICRRRGVPGQAVAQILHRRTHRSGRPQKNAFRPVSASPARRHFHETATRPCGSSERRVVGSCCHRHFFLHRRQNVIADLPQHIGIAPGRLCDEVMQRSVHTPHVIGRQARPSARRSFVPRPATGRYSNSAVVRRGRQIKDYRGGHDSACTRAGVPERVAMGIRRGQSLTATTASAAETLLKLARVLKATSRVKVVRMERVELSLPRGNWILSPARQPIPPHPPNGYKTGYIT